MEAGMTHRKTKRRTLTALVGVAALSLTAACSSGQTSSGSGAQSGADARGPITFVTGKDNSGVWPPTIEKWNKAHPNEKVTLKEQSDNADQQHDDIVQHLQAKDASYDIVTVDVIWTPEFAAKGWLVPLEGKFALDTSKLLKPPVAAATYNGKLYGFPTALTVHAMLLNLEIFKAAGVEPPKDGKWTYDEFVAKMKALNGKDYQGRKVVPFSTYVLKGYYEPWPFLLMDGGQILSKDGKQITIDSKEFVSGVQKLADLKMTHKVTDPLFGTDKVGDNFQNFGNIEKRYVAVEPWASWAIASLRTGAKYKMDFMVAEYPTGKTGKPVTIGGAGGYVVFEPKDKNAARRAMAVKFAKFISTPEVQIRHAQERGVFPASKKAAAADPFKDIPQMKAAQKLMDNAVAPPKHESWTQMQDLISAELQLVLNGEKTPEKAMADAKKNIEPLLLKK
jgi:multiple sugar transport system substrate-binding protein